jgi:ParB-like chromosome segregation protein Spo0J
MESTTETKLATITADELEALYEVNGSCLTPAQLAQTRVPLGALKTAPHVFQPRDMANQRWNKQRHVRNLAKPVKEKGMLEHITVFAVAGMCVVVDGHCRLEAYRKAGWKPTDKVAVRFLRGSFDEALKESVSANSKDKLSMTTAEKAEGAWRLVLFSENRGNYSLREIGDAANVSKSLVGIMRDTLAADRLGFDPRERSWAEVKRHRRADVEYDHAWEDKLSNKWAERLREKFGDIPERQPDVFLKALDRAYPNVVEELMERLARERRDELVDRREMVSENDDF